MTLTEALQIKERFLKFEDMRALDYVERRWQESGEPTERWEIINFLDCHGKIFCKEQAGVEDASLTRLRVTATWQTLKER